MPSQGLPNSGSPPRGGARPGRRGRPPSIDSEAILEAAREVFLERGIRATTLEVARRAGVSEGAVFHRFKTKDTLFRAAMRFDLGDAPRILTDTVRTLEGLDIEEALTRLAQHLIEVGRVAVPLMMMSWSNPDFVSPAETEKNLGIFNEMLKAFAAYFEAQMDAGRLRRMDAEILARVFIGAVHHYSTFRIFGQETSSYVIPEGMYIRGLVDLLVRGCLVPPDEPSRPSTRFRIRR